MESDTHIDQTPLVDPVATEPAHAPMEHVQGLIDHINNVTPVSESVETSTFQPAGTTLRRNLRAVEALEAYVEQHGNARVPVMYVQDGFRLGQWVSYMRARHASNANAIAKDLRDRLDALPGWAWGPLQRGPKGDAARNALIVERHTAGVTLAKIGEEFGISRQRVHQILRKANQI